MVSFVRYTVQEGFNDSAHMPDLAQRAPRERDACTRPVPTGPSAGEYDADPVHPDLPRNEQGDGAAHVDAASAHWTLTEHAVNASISLSATRQGDRTAGAWVIRGCAAFWQLIYAYTTFLVPMVRTRYQCFPAMVIYMHDYIVAVCTDLSPESCQNLLAGSAAGVVDNQLGIAPSSQGELQTAARAVATSAGAHVIAAVHGGDSDQRRVHNWIVVPALPAWHLLTKVLAVQVCGWSIGLLLLSNGALFCVVYWLCVNSGDAEGNASTGADGSAAADLPGNTRASAAVPPGDAHASAAAPPSNARASAATPPDNVRTSTAASPDDTHGSSGLPPTLQRRGSFVPPRAEVPTGCTGVIRNVLSSFHYFQVSFFRYSDNLQHAASDTFRCKKTALLAIVPVSSKSAGISTIPAERSALEACCLLGLLPLCRCSTLPPPLILPPCAAQACA